MQQIGCDVLVVGAGPAGSMAARVAAEYKLDVILLEEHKVPGTPVYCGEGISVDGILESGLEPVEPIICQRVSTVRVFAPNMKNIDLKLNDPPGYILNRDIFDKMLADKAVKAGAKLHVSTRVLTVIKEDNRITGVIATRDGEKIEYRAKIFIGADGHSSKIRSTSGLTRHFPDHVSVAQHRLTGLSLDTPGIIEIYMGDRYAPGGYAYIFPKSENTANVGVGVRFKNIKPAVEYLKDFIQHDPRLKNATIDYTTGGICPTSGRLDKITANGLILIGDAAGQVVPMTGAGIHSGILAGKIAGRTAAEAIYEGDTSERRLKAYVREFDEKCGKYIQDSKKALQMVDKFNDHDLNTLQEVITQQDIINITNGINLPATITKIIARSPIKLMKLLKTALI